MGYLEVSLRNIKDRDLGLADLCTNGIVICIQDGVNLLWNLLFHSRLQCLRFFNCGEHEIFSGGRKVPLLYFYSIKNARIEINALVGIQPDT